MNLKTSARRIPAATHGRYLLDVPQSMGPYPLLIGFHGYGENAEMHLRQLRLIPGSAEWAVGAVQALHPFYNTKTGDVVASWMTKLDREEAIRENIQYIKDVIKQIQSEENLTDTLVYAGFSQGVAMAYRAAAYCDHRCRGILALGGDVPPGVEKDPMVRLPPVLVGRGRRDEWYTQEKMDRDLDSLVSKSPRVESLIFEGGHEWKDDFLQAADKFLREINR